MEGQERQLYQGPCRDGPLDGKEATSRFPKGFLLTDKPRGRAWVYEWVPEVSEFVVRSEESMPLDFDKRIKAAEEFDYDVVAAPW